MVSLIDKFFLDDLEVVDLVVLVVLGIAPRLVSFSCVVGTSSESLLGIIITVFPDFNFKMMRSPIGEKTV